MSSAASSDPTIGTVTLPYAVIYEPATGAERQCLVGPFRDSAAALSYLAYLDDRSLTAEFDRAWVLPLHPALADPVPGVALDADGCWLEDCTARATVRIDCDGASTQVCGPHAFSYAHEGGQGTATPIGSEPRRSAGAVAPRPYQIGRSPRPRGRQQLRKRPRRRS